MTQASNLNWLTGVLMTTPIPPAHTLIYDGTNTVFVNIFAEGKY